MTTLFDLPTEPVRVAWTERRDGTKGFSEHLGILLEFTPPALIPASGIHPETGATGAKPYAVSYHEDNQFKTRRFAELRAAKRHYDIKCAQLRLRSQT